MSETAVLFLCVFALGLVLCVVRHPFYGLYTYIFAFYAHPPSRWWGEFLPEIRWSMIAACVTLLASLRIQSPPERPGWLSSAGAKFLVLFVLYMWIQTPWALDFTEHREGLTLFTKYVILFFVIYRLVQTEKDVANFLMAHVGGCIFFGYLAFGMTFSGGRLEGVGGPGVDDANTMSMHMATGMVCGAMMILAYVNWRRYAALAGAPLILNTIILAGSRGSFLGLIASAVALTMLKPQVHRRMYWVFAALGVFLFGILAHDIFWDRMSTIDDAAANPMEVDTSVESRLVLFQAQFEMFKDHPLGAGHNGTAIQSAAHLDAKYLSGGARASHNTFMTMLVNQGVVGAALYFVYVFWVVRSLFRLRKRTGDPARRLFMTQVACVGGSLSVVIVAGIFTNYLKAEIQIWMIALLACLIAIDETSSKCVSSGSDSDGEQRPLLRNASKSLAARSAHIARSNLRNRNH